MRYTILECRKCGASIAMSAKFDAALYEMLSHQVLYAYDRMLVCCNKPRIFYACLGRMEL